MVSPRFYRSSRSQHTDSPAPSVHGCHRAQGTSSSEAGDHHESPKPTLQRRAWELLASQKLKLRNKVNFSLTPFLQPNRCSIFWQGPSLIRSESFEGIVGECRGSSLLADSRWDLELDYVAIQGLKGFFQHVLPKAGTFCTSTEQEAVEDMSAQNRTINIFIFKILHYSSLGRGTANPSFFSFPTISGIRIAPSC